MNKSANIIFILLLSLLIVNWSGWPYKIRFAYPPLNYWAFAFLCLSLSVSALATNLPLNKLRRKTNHFISSIILSALALLLGAISINEASQINEKGEDLSYMFLKQVHSDLGTYRLYRTNCGATCAYGLVLRKEIDLPLGVKLVKTVWSKYRASEAELTATNSSIKILHNGMIMGEVM